MKRYEVDPIHLHPWPVGTIVNPPPFAVYLARDVDARLAELESLAIGGEGETHYYYKDLAREAVDRCVIERARAKTAEAKLREVCIEAIGCGCTEGLAGKAKILLSELGGTR